jgi:hypothetical protein
VGQIPEPTIGDSYFKIIGHLFSTKWEKPGSKGRVNRINIHLEQYRGKATPMGQGRVKLGGETVDCVYSGAEAAAGTGD